MKQLLIKKIVLLFSTATLTIAANAQTNNDTTKKNSSNPQNRFAIGYNLSQYQKDFGVGINITSPYIAKSIAFRFTGNMQWLQNIPKGDTVQTWSPYASMRLSVVTRQFVITTKISLYSEGGIVLLLPNSNFSSHSTQFGGFGVLGFEFHPSANFSQFLEAGGIGTGAIADKSIGRPIYSNGFIVSTGFRIYF